ncbi:hypothetical protein WA1_51575 [Scytonema hofmannii PCC 7110]|uniref:Uncharacterized protein n=1 Tax=Scytonema hofmannii PCC 7110 TaxID=128403 RepID=A0A139WPX9_9CYAN|nr:hypothetical protein [Scytonema hofmannii]KYC34486.1 hypothetical protein WA1_51575 [Scytonema hofmannii PCC 7110]
MFSTKINSIESQIQALTEQLNQYRTLEAELEQALGAIARLRESATKFDADVEDEVSQALVQAVGASQWVNLVEDDTSEWGVDEEPEITLTGSALPLSRGTRPTECLTEVEARESILPPDLPQQILKCKTWEEMRALALTHPEALVEAMRREPALERNLPGQIAIYINIVGKAAEKDLYSIPTVLADSVRALLASPNLTSTVKPASDIPYGEIQETARRLYDLRTWAQIRGVLQGFAPATKCEILKEFAIAASNKTKIKFLESLPTLIAKYCSDKSDRTDLDWLPGTVARKVEELLGQAAA